MKTDQKILATALVAFCVFCSAGFAQQIKFPQPVIEQPTHAIEPQAPLLQTQKPANPYYFGMSVALKRDSWGTTTLQFVNVTPGSPAAHAGLETGDEIRSVNGNGFELATDSFDAVRILNRNVQGGPPPPLPPGSDKVVILGFPSPNAKLVVRNVRNGQDVLITVYPSTSNISPAAPARARAGG